MLQNLQIHWSDSFRLYIVEANHLKMRNTIFDSVREPQTRNNTIPSAISKKLPFRMCMNMLQHRPSKAIESIASQVTLSQSKLSLPICMLKTKLCKWSKPLWSDLWNHLSDSFRSSIVSVNSLNMRITIFSSVREPQSRNITIPSAIIKNLPFRMCTVWGRIDNLKLSNVLLVRLLWVNQH